MTYEEFIDQIVQQIKEKAKDMVFYAPGRDFARVRKICKYDEAIKKAYHIFIEKDDIKRKFELAKNSEIDVKLVIDKESDNFIRLINRTSSILYKNLVFEVNRLNEIPTELEQDRVRLKAQIYDMTCDRDSLEAQINDMTCQRERLEEQIKAISCQRDSLDERINFISHDRDQLNEQINAMTCQRERLSEVIEDLLR